MTSIGLHGVQLSQAALGHANELGLLGHFPLLDGLAIHAALGHALNREANLVLLLDDDVPEDGARAGLGLQRLGDLMKLIQDENILVPRLHNS